MLKISVTSIIHLNQSVGMLENFSSEHHPFIGFGQSTKPFICTLGTFNLIKPNIVLGAGLSG